MELALWRYCTQFIERPHKETEYHKTELSCRKSVSFSILLRRICFDSCVSFLSSIQSDRGIGTKRKEVYKHPDNEIIEFCEECNTFFCGKCLENNPEHKYETLREFYERKTRNLQRKIYSSDIPTLLEERTKIQYWGELSRKNIRMLNKNFNGERNSFKMDWIIHSTMKALIW